jgi:hypothetical protein
VAIAIIEGGLGERSDLVVPLRRVAVELCLGGQAARQVELFLSEHGERGERRQQVVDLLQGRRQFVPCRDSELGTLAFINRDHILWLALPLAEDQVGDESAELGPLFDQHHQVTLHLAGGMSLEGALLYSAPVEHARLVDHVNQPGGFLVLHRGGQILLVRKSAVLEIVENG